MPGLLCPRVTSLPCSWGTLWLRQEAASSSRVPVLHHQEVTASYTSWHYWGCKLTIWGPTFTLIGPKVFGKILVGELVLETGNVITEILPKKNGKRRVLNYFLSNLWKTLWQILTPLQSSGIRLALFHLLWTHPQVSSRPLSRCHKDTSQNYTFTIFLFKLHVFYFQKQFILT